MGSPALLRLPAVTFLLAVFGAMCARAKTIKYLIDVEFNYGNPDCGGDRLLFTGNGVWPGPLINVTLGDIVEVTVRNLMYQEGAGIHWHGLKQRGTPYLDGVVGVSQCAIEPGTNMTYRLDTTFNVGTYWWHSHYVLQNTAALYGPIIINPKAPNDDRKKLGYDVELAPMLLGDWYHKSVNEQSYGLEKNPTVWVGDPDSGLINGQGIYNCFPNTTTGCVYNSTQCGFPVINVVKGRRYRLRLINAASLSYLNFAIQGHTLTIVEAEGNYIAPVNVKTLDINAGQTYSVLFTANQPKANYWINTKTQYLKASTNVRGAAILRYSGAPAVWPTGPFFSGHPKWNDSTFSIAQQNSLHHRSDYIRPPPKVVTRPITIVLQETLVNGGVLKEAVNNKTLIIPTTPYLLQQAYGLLHDNGKRPYDSPAVTYNYTESLCMQNITQNGDQGSIIYTTGYKEVIQIVVQNSVNCRLASGVHPWHLHGHDFWVVGFGLGIYNASTSPKTFNLKNPIKRNTMSVYPVGWTAIRFVTDNPGMWLFHCHNSFHLEMGMGVVFNEAPYMQPKLPKNFPTCGDLTTTIIGKNPNP